MRFTLLPGPGRKKEKTRTVSSWWQLMQLGKKGKEKERKKRREEKMRDRDLDAMSETTQ